MTRSNKFFSRKTTTRLIQGAMMLGAATFAGACGEGEQDGQYKGEPLFRVQANLIGGVPAADEGLNLKAAIAWAVPVGTSDEEAIAAGALEVVDFDPSQDTFSLDLFSKPPAIALAHENDLILEPGLAAGIPIIINDLNNDGEIDWKALPDPENATDSIYAFSKGTWVAYVDSQTFNPTEDSTFFGAKAGFSAFSTCAEDRVHHRHL